MNMFLAIRRSIHANISIRMMHIRISLINIRVSIRINAGISLSLQQNINVSTSIGDIIINIINNHISIPY